jgi:DNA-binding CsgD family transcriptional regulator
MTTSRVSKRAAAEALIATVEATYDLEPTDDQWFPRLLEANLPLMDHGLGAGGLIAVKGSTPAEPFRFESTHVIDGPEDLIARHIASIAALPPERTHEQTRSGVFIISEQTTQHPEMYETWCSFFDGAKDAIGLMAIDTNGRGVHILAPTPEIVRLGVADRNRWEMLAAHITSGVRLRAALRPVGDERSETSSELPLGAEAVIAPKDFQVTEAVSSIQDADALHSLRQAAARIDRARAEGRREDAVDEALSDWWALVSGRWSMVDWFDTDGRRYVLALPNPPNVPDPRGLTEQERQVTAYALLGDSHKMIAYRLGVSRSRVTHLLGSAMRKLGVKSQAQLIAKMAAFALAAKDRPGE